MRIHTVTLDPAVDILGDQRYAGGKGINTARALVLLGVKDVAAYAFVGGRRGEEFYRLVRQDNILFVGIPIIDETRFTEVLPGEQERKRSSPSPNIQPSEFALLRARLERSVSSGDYVVLSGRVPHGLPTSVYGDLIVLCKSRGAKCILDASQVDYARGGLAERPYMMKGNEEEWNALGIPISVALAGGVIYCVVTRGYAGCELVSTTRRIVATPPKVQVKSAVGSGDCLTAGFLYGCKERYTLEECVAFAVACGSVAAKNGGARCSLAEAKGMQVRTQISNAAIP